MYGHRIHSIKQSRDFAILLTGYEKLSIRGLLKAALSI